MFGTCVWARVSSYARFQCVSVLDAVVGGFGWFVQTRLSHRHDRRLLDSRGSPVPIWFSLLASAGWNLSFRTKCPVRRASAKRLSCLSLVCLDLQIKIIPTLRAIQTDVPVSSPCLLRPRRHAYLTRRRPHPHRHRALRFRRAY